MAEYTVEEDKQVAIVPKGFYKAILVLMEKADNYETSEYKYLTGFWKITEGNLKDSEVRESYPENFSPSSKIGLLFEAITGKTLVPGTKVNTDTLLNVPCTIAVNIQTVKNKKTGKEFTKNIVESVMKN